MSFSEHPPSKQWAALKFRGEIFAEVWFKPREDPLVLTFRIPKESFQIPGMAQQLTIENLLKAVAVTPAEVESWRQGDLCYSGQDGSSPDFKSALPPPAQHATHLDIDVRIKAAPESVASNENKERAASSAKWQDFETRWKSILALEATIETLRISMEGLLTEVESLSKKPLTMEEKTYAPRADVAHLNKARNRVHIALPKIKDFIHRSVWATGSPERKRLEEIHDEHVQSHLASAEIDEVLKQLEGLRKDRQVLSAQGKTIYQECKGISAELQTVLRTLHGNAVNAQKKKGAAGSKGRH